MFKESNNRSKHIWPPFTQIKESSHIKRVTSAKGVFLNCDDGSHLIDAISSWWVTLHGHSNLYIANEISRQAKELEQVIFADFSHPQAEKLAARLAKLTGLDRLFFSDNGSTAVEVAIKISYQWWKNKGENRKQIIAFDGAYHGDTFGAMAVGERNLFNEPFEELLFPVARAPWPSTWINDIDLDSKEGYSLAKLEELLKIPTAAVIIEPLLQGAGGMRVVREQFLLEVEKLVHRSGALLIADEVLTGFGRCGEIFAFKKAKIQPDIVALSKGLTGGFLPMGVTMVKEYIFNNFVGNEPRLTFWHGHSFTANPLGCAAANASLDLLESDSTKYRNLETMHKKYIEEIVDHKLVEKVRIKGTVAAFEIKSYENEGYLNSVGKVIKQIAIDNGVFIRPLGNVVYLMPPLCINNEQLKKCYDVIKIGINNLK
tara:strand:- start:5184 stop:6470 length:1287 start_codon:yes stop_codon:yes gene_type:complete